MSDTILALKSKVRSRMRKALNSLDISLINKLSIKAQKQIIQSKIFKDARSIALYSSYQNEMETFYLFEESKKNGKQVAYPRIIESENSLHFFWVNSLLELSPSLLGPLEPDHQLCSSLAELAFIDLMVIPGLAFDLKGWRVGRGKGFYDKVLKKFFGVRLGLAYSFQIIESLPYDEEIDEPIHWLATENKFIQIN